MLSLFSPDIPSTCQFRLFIRWRVPEITRKWEKKLLLSVMWKCLETSEVTRSPASIFIVISESSQCKDSAVQCSRTLVIKTTLFVGTLSYWISRTVCCFKLMVIYIQIESVSFKENLNHSFERRNLILPNSLRPTFCLKCLFFFYILEGLYLKLSWKFC